MEDAKGKSKREREGEDRAVRAMLESDYCPAAIAEARSRQDSMLTDRFHGKPYAIADLGCGTGYHGSLFAPGCRLYHGFEIAPEIADIARERWRSEGLRNTELFVGDIADAPARRDFYDLVFCLYFTPGNLRDASTDLALYRDEYLDKNPKFVAVASLFHRALKPGGKMLLTVYKDCPAAEAAQVDFYLHNGQTIASPPGSRFVATDSGFWSVRWTKESMLSNLLACGVTTGGVRFHDLNEIAWLVEVER
jgi:SAM-dependent methyltransferase